MANPPALGAGDSRFKSEVLDHSPELANYPDVNGAQGPRIIAKAESLAEDKLNGLIGIITDHGVNWEVGFITGLGMMEASDNEVGITFSFS